MVHVLQPNVYANSSACDHLANMCVLTLYANTLAPVSSPQTVCDYYVDYADGEQWSVAVVLVVVARWLTGRASD